MTIQFLWSVDNRGDRPNTAGLQESINIPTLDISRNFEMCYQYGLNVPSEGLHKYLKDYVFRKEYWANVFSWIDIWCPNPNFEGYINLDLEFIPLFKDELPSWGAINDRWLEYQGEVNQKLSWEVAARQYFTDTLRLVKLCRPKAKVAYWNTPGFRPEDIFKNETELNKIRTKHNKAEWFYRLSDYLLPCLYMPAPLNGTDNWSVTEAQLDRWIELNINEQNRLKNRFAPNKEFIFCISSRYGVTAGPYYDDGSYLKPEEFHKLVEKISAYGYNKIALWDTLDSVESKNKLESLLNDYSVIIRRAPIDPPIVMG